MLDCIGGLLSGIHTGFFVPFYAVIARGDLGADEFMIALLSSGPYIGGMAALFYGGLAALNKELKWYVWTSVTARVCVLLVAICSSSLWFSFWVFVVYAIMACAEPQYALVVQRIYPMKYRASLMGYVKVIFGIATLLSTLLAGALMGDGEGWRIFFVISGVLAVASSIVFGFVKCPEVPDNGEKRENVFRFMCECMRLLKENRNNTILIIFATLYTIGNMIQTVVLPIYQVDTLHINPGRMSVLMAVQNTVTMLSYPVWGRYIDKFNARKGWILCMWASAVFPMGYYLAGNWTHVIWAHAMMGFATAGAGLAWFNMVLELTERGKEGKYQALHYFFGGIRGMMGVVGGALLVSVFSRAGGEHIRMIFPVISLLLILSTVALFRMAGWFTGRRSEK